MPSPSALSAELRAAADAERALVMERVRSLTEQSRRMHDMATAVDDDLASAQRLLCQLDEMLGLAPQLSITHADDVLRGQHLRDVAIQTLKAHRGEGVSMHYREWYDLVVQDGHRIVGKDPVASFLTQVSRAPEVESVGRRSGLYRLRVA